MADTVHDVAATAHTVIARKAFRCQSYRCHNMVQPGEPYARHVAFPGHDCNDGPAPWVLRICSDCQAPKPMPARTFRKTPTG
jgi:hypothetical protein